MQRDAKQRGSFSQAKNIFFNIIEYALDEIEKDKTKIGVLLCEGDLSSIDKVVYSAVFPKLLVIPLGGCSNIMRLYNRVKNLMALNGMYAFAIIDRDALSKQEIKNLLREKGIYVTKLPFIENIISAPAVIKLVCEDLKMDYDLVIEKIHEQLIKILWQRLKESLPINLGIEKYERIETLQIGASTKFKSIEKTVDRENILYVYRSKTVVSIVANVLHMTNRPGYYSKIRQMISDKRYSAKLVKIMSGYIPDLDMYDLDFF